jgi:hypothetical protein
MRGTSRHQNNFNMAVALCFNAFQGLCQKDLPIGAPEDNGN